MAEKPRPSRGSARKSYINDPFEGIKGAIYASSDSGSSTSEAPEEASEPEIPAQEVEEEEEEDDLVIEDERNPSDEDAGPAEAIERDDEGESVIGVDDTDEEGMSDGGTVPASSSLAATYLRAKGEPVHSMGISKRRIKGIGIDDWDLRGGKELRCTFLFGPTKEDMEPVIKTRDKWEQHLVLPFKGEAGLARSFFVGPEALKAEKKRIRDWYWEGGGKQAFMAGQETKVLSEAEGRLYLPNGSDIQCFMGPVINQSLYTMKTGDFMSTATPFENKDNRPGWVFNLGARIVDAQWAPNEEGRTQYLAVVVDQRKAGTKPSKPELRSPAFAPFKGFPASIQIWAFDPLENGDVDIDSPPRLEFVICTEWGAAKQIKWSPVATSDTLEPQESSDKIHLGFLAGVFMDGKTRILDVWYPKPDPISPQTHYLHFTRTAFDVHPPGTVSTCLTWLSAATLAIGTASGCVGIWTLTRRETFPQPTSATTPPSATAHYEAIPWFYKMLAYSYVLTLCSGYPSRPSFISITSVDGFSRLFDLRHADTESLRPPRTRIFGNTQTWHEQTQSFMTPDENYMMRNHTLRRYYMNIHSFAVESTVLCCAASPLHPIVLLGSAGGVVNAGNPIGRILDVKEMPWQQIWFTHEWRRGKRAEDEEEEGGDEDAEGEEDESMEMDQMDGTADRVQDANITKPEHIPADILNGPLSRITEGFKPRSISLQRHHSQQGGPSGLGNALITVYEEKTAITCLAWNPNLRCGTWAVAGMGDGLLRVEDIGV